MGSQGFHGFESHSLLQMSKRVEYSTDMIEWKNLGVWTEEEAEENWPKLQEWIEQTQVFGFFRMVDEE